MSYVTSIEGFEGQNIEVKVSFWSGAKLLINGENAPKGTKRGEMVLQRNDGRQVSASWKQQIFGVDVPQLIVDGKVIELVTPLKWYQWVWAALPVALFTLGGALGAIIGILGFTINAKVFRSNLNGISKYLVSGMVSVLAFVVYLLLATVFSYLIGR